MPARPRRSSTPFGALLLAIACAARAGAAVIAVADDDALARLPTLKAGDIVELTAPLYHRAFCVNGSGTRDAPIVVRGIGAKRPVIDATGERLDGIAPRPRACVQANGVHVIVEHLELVGARNGDNGSGFRATSPAEDPADPVVLRDCVIHDCDMGVQGDGGAHLTIDACEVFRCGTDRNPGASHDIYITGLRWATIRGSWIHDSTTGYGIKSRAHYTEVLYSLVSDCAEGEMDFVDSDLTTAADSNVLLLGDVVVSKARATGANHSRFICFGGEGAGHRGTLYAYHDTFVAGAPGIDFLVSQRAECAIVACDDLFVGGASLGGPRLSGRGNWTTVAGPAPDGFLAGRGDPVFASTSGRDFHLTAGSPCRDLGVVPLTYRDGSGTEHVATAEWMIGAAGALDRRGVDQRPDIGAYEFGGAIGPAKRRPAGLVGLR